MTPEQKWKQEVFKRMIEQNEAAGFDRNLYTQNGILTRQQADAVYQQQGMYSGYANAARVNQHALDASLYAQLKTMGTLMTPEGKVKAMVKARISSLSERHPDRPFYSWWPVTNGMGAPGLDCIGCVNGRMFAIETKAPGGKVTPRQELTIEDMRKSGGVVFVVSAEDDMIAFELWAEACFALTS